MDLMHNLEKQLQLQEEDERDPEEPDGSKDQILYNEKDLFDWVYYLRPRLPPDVIRIIVEYSKACLSELGLESQTFSDSMTIVFDPVTIDSDIIESLWENPLVQSRHFASEFSRIGNESYFLDNYRKISRPGYVLTDADILRCNFDMFKAISLVDDGWGFTIHEVKKQRIMDDLDRLAFVFDSATMDVRRVAETKSLNSKRLSQKARVIDTQKSYFQRNIEYFTKIVELKSVIVKFPYILLFSNTENLKKNSIRFRGIDNW
eukprot:TRINITY_DN3526_c0_g1_i1.p1 TRINITY_DN3526_c0_g1~~TRINITY_DN3526_c0_g1_i1.p1  ORF type:complete len:261 (-),score=44.59 TRINITY_DN3526_c0_g1_i1:221-1003(-)